MVKEKCIEVCASAPYARRTWRGALPPPPPPEVFHATGGDVRSNLYGEGSRYMRNSSDAQGACARGSDTVSGMLQVPDAQALHVLT